MVIKFIESTYDSVKDKLKNPFYGTLFVVWVIRNRKFIYNVFFNDSVTSDERLELIRAHFLNWDSLLSFIGTILISLGLMILIYASLNLSRFIVELSERILKPWIQQLFSKTSIVSREDYIQLEKDRDYFQKKYSEERSEKIRLQRELDEMSIKYIPTSDEKSSAIAENIKTIINSWTEQTMSDFKTLIGSINNYLGTTDINRTINKSINDFLSLNIIERYIDKFGDSKYKFTEYGETFRNIFLETKS